MPEALKILFLASEVAPLAKTGGLADVAYALPRALHEAGHDARVAMPCYGFLPQSAHGERCAMTAARMNGHTIYGALRLSEVPGTEVPLYLVEHENYFNREHPYQGAYGEYRDNLERFSFFSVAALDGVQRAGWAPDVVHCNDWHTAVAPAYLATRLRHDPFWARKPSLLTIHNLGYQGRFSTELFPQTGLPQELLTPDYFEYYGDLNLLKGGIAFSTKVSTVSRRYAREIQTPEWGCGLDGFLRKRADDVAGIVNGVDYTEWNPGTDKRIAASYTKKDLTGKAVCKRALQKELSLPVSDAPLFGIVSRLVWNKGLDLLVDALPAMLGENLQLVVLGTGDAYYETALADGIGRRSDRARVVFRYSDDLAHRIYAGADFFLMPSHFEPCGLGQLYAMAYGAVPVVRRTGGLADTVRDITPANRVRGRATGLTFSGTSGESLAAEVRRAMELYGRKEAYRAVQVAGMAEDFSWRRASEAYVALYERTIADA